MDRVKRIKKAQQAVGTNNKYKQYFINNKEYIKRLLAVNKDVSTVDEAMVLIRQIDFRYIFGLDVLMEKTFMCEFMYKEQCKSFAFKTEKEADKVIEKESVKYTGREVCISGYERFGMKVRELTIKGDNLEAWVSYSINKNKYLYMVGDKTKENYCANIDFDVLDLYQIFIGCDIRKVIQDLSKLLEIRITELEIIRDKYNRCKKFIKGNLTKDNFPALFELISVHIAKLEIILDEGIEKLYWHTKSETGMAFSMSLQYIAGIMKKSKSTINPVINTFALLGLIQKPNLNQVKYTKWNRNEITYFYIPEYNQELFEKGEQLAKIMLYSGKRTTASCFSYMICKAKFGEEVANLIFKDKVIKARAS
ncbi:hypothetical protein [Clostridium ljungdahlii]|uniref:Uncharacterized protein n=1 Tax=Clostridium ljungdahlii TaxID=1538 RepID=A0A168PIM8_9CLOT|nr:hypothetical protein [Clostridium ljungdahlii]OAA87790.1 hypothetical protein WY13_01905 [Clostridium ljungdahlii]